MGDVWLQTFMRVSWDVSQGHPFLGRVSLPHSAFISLGSTCKAHGGVGLISCSQHSPILSSSWFVMEKSQGIFSKPIPRSKPT